MIVRLAGPADLPACLEVRRVVFVEEQRVPLDEEVDGHDPACVHAIALVDGRPVGAARLSERGGAHLQRVAVLAPFRGRGVGAALVAWMEGEARARGHARLELHAQVSAIVFYERLGYAAEGPVFLDAGIEHRAMSKRLG